MQAMQIASCFGFRFSCRASSNCSRLVKGAMKAGEVNDHIKHGRSIKFIALKRLKEKAKDPARSQMKF